MSVLINKPHTGIVLDATEGAISTLTQPNFNGNWDVPQIQNDLKIIEIEVPGTLGVTDTVIGSSKAGVSGAKIPAGSSLEVDLMKLIGGKVAVDGSKTTILFGGQNYLKTGVNVSRISTDSATIWQYTGTHLVKLTNSKIINATVSGKENETIVWEMDFSGIYSATAEDELIYVQTPTANPFLAFANTAITLGGIELMVSDISLNMGITVADRFIASEGVYVSEVVGIKPEITINPEMVAPSTFDFFDMYETNSQMEFTWVYGNCKWSATTKMNSNKPNLNNGIRNCDIVLGLISALKLEIE